MTIQVKFIHEIISDYLTFTLAFLAWIQLKTEINCAEIIYLTLKNDSKVVGWRERNKELHMIPFWNSVQFSFIIFLASGFCNLRLFHFSVISRSYHCVCVYGNYYNGNVTVTGKGNVRWQLYIEIPCSFRNTWPSCFFFLFQLQHYLLRSLADKSSFNKNWLSLCNT